MERYRIELVTGEVLWHKNRFSAIRIADKMGGDVYDTKFNNDLIHVSVKINIVCRCRACGSKMQTVTRCSNKDCYCFSGSGKWNRVLKARKENGSLCDCGDDNCKTWLWYCESWSYDLRYDSVDDVLVVVSNKCKDYFDTVGEVDLF